MEIELPQKATIPKELRTVANVQKEAIPKLTLPGIPKLLAFLLGMEGHTMWTTTLKIIPAKIIDTIFTTILMLAFVSEIG